jgi:predicted neuraminidase
VLAPTEQQKLLPPGNVHPGTSWQLDPEVMARLLRHFYPPTENTDVRGNRLDQQALQATVLALQGGVARARVQGRLKMKHSFYHKDTDEFVAADVVGLLEFEPGRPRVRSLRLVTDRATYGQAHANLPFGVAVRSVAESAQDGVVQAEFLFTKAPFRECHASTIAQTRTGTLLAAWFGGPREGHLDVSIWVARRTGRRWGKPVEVANGVAPAGPRRPCWNPVLFQPHEGPVLLFYKVGPGPASWWGMLTTSADDGRTWSVPRRLPEGILGPIKDKPVQMPNGDLLCPSSTEDHGWRVHFERSADLGKSWTRTGPVNDGQEIAAIQPSILSHHDGRLQALCRSRQGRVCQTWSRDQGRTWSPLELTDLPNPNSGLDAVTLADGQHLLVYNHTTRGRSPLNVAVSEDGRTWKAALVLEKEPGEYSYPAVVQTPDGLVHITYTWKRQRIKHVVLDPKRLVLTELDPPGPKL